MTLNILVNAANDNARDSATVLPVLSYRAAKKTVVSSWQKYVKNVLNHCLEAQAWPRKSVCRLTDWL